MRRRQSEGGPAPPGLPAPVWTLEAVIATLMREPGANAKLLKVQRHLEKRARRGRCDAAQAETAFRAAIDRQLRFVLGRDASVIDAAARQAAAKRLAERVSTPRLRSVRPTDPPIRPADPQAKPRWWARMLGL